MIKLVLILIAVMLCGCAHVKLDGTDPNTGYHTSATMTFFCMRSEVAKLNIGKATKTTSLLLGADSSAMAPDKETIAAASEAFARGLVSGAKVP